MAGGEPDFDQFMQQVRRPLRRQPAADRSTSWSSRCSARSSQMQNLLDITARPTCASSCKTCSWTRSATRSCATELSELAANLEYMYPQRDMRNQYPFRGDEELDLNEAMRPHGQACRTWTSWSASSSAPSTAATSTTSTRRSCGSCWATRPPRRSTSSSSSSRSSRRPATSASRGNTWELTPRGTRKIGQKALGEIYSQLKQDRLGKHEVTRHGPRRRAQRRHQALRVRRPVPPAPRARRS